MPKHPVPKQKTSKGRTSRRYKSFARTAKKKLSDRIHLIKCQNCGNSRLVHHACPECGTYKKRQIVDMERKIEKITKVKA